MKKVLAILLLISSPVFAGSTAEQTTPGYLSSGGTFTPYSSTNPLPVSASASSITGTLPVPNGGTSAANPSDAISVQDGAVLNASKCSGTSLFGISITWTAPSWCSGSDIGAWVNSATAYGQSQGYKYFKVITDAGQYYAQSTTITVPYNEYFDAQNSTFAHTSTTFVAFILGDPEYTAGTSTGTASARVLTPTVPATFSLIPDATVSFVVAGTNTGASTINVSSSGALPILKRAGTSWVPLTGGEMVNGNTYYIIYSGSFWMLQDNFANINVDQRAGTHNVNVTGPGSATNSTNTDVCFYAGGDPAGVISPTNMWDGFDVLDHVGCMGTQYGYVEANNAFSDSIIGKSVFYHNYDHIYSPAGVSNAGSTMMFIDSGMSSAYNCGMELDYGNSSEWHLVDSEADSFINTPVVCGTNIFLFASNTHFENHQPPFIVYTGSGTGNHININNSYFESDITTGTENGYIDLSGGNTSINVSLTDNVFQSLGTTINYLVYTGGHNGFPISLKGNSIIGGSTAYTDLVGALGQNPPIQNVSSNATPPQWAILSGTNGPVGQFDQYTSTPGGGLYLRTAHGTSTSPTTVAVGDSLIGISFWDYIPTTGFVPTASINPIVDTGTVSSASAPSALVFKTTPNLSTTRAEVARFSSTGFMGLGTTSPITSLDIRSATNGGISLYEKVTGVGTVTNAANSATIVGTGTQFTRDFTTGDIITIPSSGGNGPGSGQSVTVTVVDDTHMTAGVNITSANTGVAYDPISFTSVGANQSTPLFISGTIDNFLQANLINLSTGQNAQAGYSATTTNGSDVTGFVGFYTNGSGFTNARASVFNTGHAGDGAFTCLTAGKDCYLSNLDSAGNIYIQTGGNADANRHVQLDTYGHLGFMNAAPTVTSGAGACGTSAAIIAGSTDTAGRVTVGSSTNGGNCPIVFSHAFSVIPSCVANDETTGVLVRAVPALGGVTITGVIVASDKLSWQCFGQPN